jgi:hypothetical protein
MNEDTMRIERSISTGPRRGTEQTCVAIAQFVTTILDQRGYPGTVKSTAQVEKTFPLLRFLLSTRGFAEPAITIAMPGLQVDLTVSYDPQADDDLTPPNTVLLDQLSADDVIHIEMNSADQVSQALQKVPRSASSETVKFSLARKAAASAPDADRPDRDDAQPEPDGTQAERDDAEPELPRAEAAGRDAKDGDLLPEAE